MATKQPIQNLVPIAGSRDINRRWNSRHGVGSSASQPPSQRRAWLHVGRFLLVPTLVVGMSGCYASSHPVMSPGLGVPASTEAFLELVDTPGPLEVETIHSATWQVDRAGLINLKHPRAVAAGLESGDEPINIDFHTLRHPELGLFLVDTGVEHRFRDAIEDTPTSWLVRAAMNIETLKVKVTLSDYLAQANTPVKGVFLTHLHLDHILGMPDLPLGTPIYAGPGETEENRWPNLLSRSSTDEALEGHRPIEEFRFAPAPDAPFEGILDVFRDGTLWALWMPGHTVGSVAYLVRTPKGPVLLTGDACHTKWGWEHQVEPGEFSSNLPRSSESLARLERFVTAHPRVEVRLGHQDLTSPRAVPASPRSH